MIIKLHSLLLFLSAGMTIFGQDSPPIIKANSDTVDIRIGNDHIIKGGWYLEPDVKPDIFYIDSKWNYDDFEVSFITDMDSISFNIQPASTYDFVVLLKKNTPCHIRIVSLAQPVFLGSKALWPTILVLLVLGLFLFSKRNSLRINTLLLFGIICPMMFWAITLICGYIYGNYSHLKNVISALGSIGKKSEIVSTVSFVPLSVFCALFSVGFFMASRRLKLSVIPAILTLVMPMGMFWSMVLFPMGHEFHASLGPMPLLLNLAALLTFILWSKRKDTNVSKIRLWSLISFFVMMLLALRFTTFGREYQGLVQRFWYVGWSIWYISLSFYLSKGMASTKVK